MFCSKCGNQLNDESIFCSKCGRKVAVDEVHSRSSNEQAAELEPSIINSSVKEEQTADDSKYLSAYVGKNADYFIEKWKKAKKPGVSPNWNWAAFFLTPFWLGYRKMNLHLVLYTLLVLITGLLFLESEYNVLAVIISLFYGFYGNTLYYRKANKAVDSVRHLNLDAEKSVYRLEQMGGTSKLGAFFGVLSFFYFRFYCWHLPYSSYCLGKSFLVRVMTNMVLPVLNPRLMKATIFTMKQTLAERLTKRV